MLPYNNKLKEHSRELRKNMTEAEIYLWVNIRLKQLKGLQFYRQKIIGNYIVDFYCPRAKLVIEVDGSQHYVEPKIESDKARDAYLIEQGLKVLRFTDADIFENIEGVIDVLLKSLELI